MEEEKIIISLVLLLLSFACFFGTTSSQLNLVVAQDGSGNFTTISDALAFTPNFSTNLIYITIKKGIYRENIEVSIYKTNIVFIGDGINNTIITGNRSEQSGWGTSESATVGVQGSGFVAKDISFENTAGPESGQAVAFRSSADKTAMYRCAFLGYQDTLFVVTNRQFYRDCDIYGTIDFIFGDATVVLQNCNIYARQQDADHKAVITAQGRSTTSSNTGISIQNCTIAMDPGSPEVAALAYFGRPWRTYSRVMIMESYLEGVVNPVGWLDWAGDPKSLDNVYYAEYKNMGPGAGTSQRTKCLGCKILMDPNEAQYFTVRQFINGLDWIPNTGIPFSPDFCS